MPLRCRAKTNSARSRGRAQCDCKARADLIDYYAIAIDEPPETYSIITGINLAMFLYGK